MKLNSAFLIIDMGSICNNIAYTLAYKHFVITWLVLQLTGTYNSQ